MESSKEIMWYGFYGVVAYVRCIFIQGVGAGVAQAVGEVFYSLGRGFEYCGCCQECITFCRATGEICITCKGALMSAVVLIGLKPLLQVSNC